MADYTELVKKLRDDNACLSIKTAHEAADAIEKLQKVANKLLAKYQEEAEGMIWEYGGHIDESMDYLHEEVRRLQAQIDGKQEPPKEETE